MRNRLVKLSLIICSILPHYSFAGNILIEAEKGALLNGATVINSTLCSEGRKVGNLGDPSKNGGVKFSVDIEMAGTYMLDIYYLAGEDRSFKLTINENDSSQIDCLSTNGWDMPGITSTSITLESGQNTLLFNNNTNYAPDLDMIILKKIDSGDKPSEHKSFTYNDWQINIDTTSGKADLYFNNSPLLYQAQASFKIDSTIINEEEMTQFSISESELSDEIGTGKLIQVTSKTSNEKITLKHNYYLYQNQNYILTDIMLESNEDISSNYLAPIFTDSACTILPTGKNQSLWVPFDNDWWVKYSTLDFGVPLNSYEVSTFLNSESREGIVVGSVKHDTWKTGIRAKTEDENILKRLEVFGGSSSMQSRDVIEHGKIKGKQITSPKIFIGRFEDWRHGLETFADVNETYAPKLEWKKAKPFGWNSWGAIQTNLSYKNASEVSEYFANNLQNNNFQNDSTVYIGLDSYWDNITYSDLVKFVRECKKRGQNAGIYWTPFVDWAKNPNRQVEGSSYYYKDIYLYADGKPQEIAGAYAIDPTHPATKERMNLYLNRFIAQGFTYLKLDFMTHGALEADSHYDPTVFTGIQAYNQGLQYIIDYLDGKMFLNLSISPLFPTQYAHSRRIACDAYGSIAHSEYTLNSLSYGWWLDHMYTYNDADNVVFDKYSTGENRARVTSSVITGIFIVGDDYSTSGSSSAKTRAQEFLTNDNINKIARTTKAFYPVETATNDSSTDMFMQTVEDTLYLAVFNFNYSSATKFIDFERINLEANTNYIVHELWNDEYELKNNSWEVSIGRKDVKMYKIYKGSEIPTHDNMIDSYIIREPSFYPNPVNEILYLEQPEDISKLTLYNINGEIIKIFENLNKELNLGNLPQGVYLLSVINKNATQKNQILVKE